MAEKGKHIDHIIREKMSRVNPQFDASSWDQLADRLEQSEMAEDAVLRDRMEQLKPDYAAASWATLSEKLEVSEAQIDEAYRRKLRSVRPAFNEGSWAILTARIEQQNRRAQTILSYKFAELSLLLLLLFVFWQFGPLQPDTNHQRQTPVASPQYVLPGATQPMAAIKSPITPLADTNTRQEAIAENEDAASQSIAANSTLGIVNLKNKTLYSLDGAFAEIQVRSIHNKVVAPELLPSITINGLDQKDLTTGLAESDMGSQLLSETEALSTVQAIASLDWMSPVSTYPSEDIDLLALLKPVERKTSFRVGFAGSPDYNRVITPAIAIPGQDTAIGLDRYSLGYSGGLSFGIERGRWEIELGALYAVRSYENLPIIALAGNIREGYQGVSLKKNELNMLNVSVNFRYNFFVHDKWRVYGLTGGGISSVLQANYYVVNEEAFNLQFSPPRPNVNGGRTDITDELLVSERPQGLLGGGRFWNNTSIQMNVGFGLERYMSHRWSIFAQPTYQHSVFSPFRGFGPYHDNIHTMSFLMGMKVKL